MLAHIDADYLRYLGGSSLVERRWYEVEGVSSPPFHYKKDVLLYCEENNLEPNVVQRQEVINEDLLYELIDENIDRVLLDTGATEFILFIEGKDNFRKIRYPEYKSNRTSSLRPLLAQEAKDYLTQVYGAVPSDGMEADDAVAISYNEHGGILCSNDKDLIQVPGTHYNPQTREIQEVQEEYALRHLYKQILSGDAGDGIPGVKGIGKKKAEKYIQNCSNDQEMWEVALELHDSWEQANLTAELVYILRKQGDVWLPPDSLLSR